jgi:23S rRNA (uracil1939-C5)-methyltransferase
VPLYPHSGVAEGLLPRAEGRAADYPSGVSGSPSTASRPAAAAQLELTIDALAFGGKGVARADGYVVFVPGTVPGDRVRAQLTKRRKTFADSRLLEIVEPSPDRIASRAPHPGAPWQILPYDRQLVEKESQVRDALKRIGAFPEPPVEPILPAGSAWRYRNKVEYSFGTAEDGDLVLGFHRPGRWDVVDDVREDILASERVDALRESVRTFCRQQGLEAQDRGGLLRNLVVREGRRTGQLQARVVTAPGRFPAEAFAAAVEADSLLWTQAESTSEASRGGETELLAGLGFIEEELFELTFRISPDAFFQTNTEMAERLYTAAGDVAGLSGRERVFDLYSGIGTIAMSLALRAREVWGIEQVEAAVEDARDSARRNAVDNVEFVAGDVRVALGPLVERVGRPDVVLVDPPRAGLSPKIVRRLLEAAPARVVYVSCNPTTLAPNARQMTDAGYELRTVRPVDMFPQTPHIECVALLERAT